MKANHNPEGQRLVFKNVVASTTKIQKWKQITTGRNGMCGSSLLLPVRQRYKNESKSQLPGRYAGDTACCCQYDKDTKMKANHNSFQGISLLQPVVASTTKIQKWKQITTVREVDAVDGALLPVRQRYKNESKSQLVRPRVGQCDRCCQYDKDTKMKANHNRRASVRRCSRVVASTTKIQKWKQITTTMEEIFLASALLPVRQRYKNESKSQQQARITREAKGCCQYDKDTKMKANHNTSGSGISGIFVVASTTKIQKWKQITTYVYNVYHSGQLLPVRQRYKNESKSQPHGKIKTDLGSCCQYDKDTKMKANHNS